MEILGAVDTLGREELNDTYVDNLEGGYASYADRTVKKVDQLADIKLAELRTVTVQPPVKLKATHTRIAALEGGRQKHRGGYGYSQAEHTFFKYLP